MKSMKMAGKLAKRRDTAGAGGLATLPPAPSFAMRLFRLAANPTSFLCNLQQVRV